MNVQSKKIGLFSAIIIQMNAMIGAGVVTIPAILSQSTGALGLIVYALCFLIIFCMTVSLGELSLLYGGDVWCFRFPSLWGKHRTGMIASSLYVIGILVSMGFVAREAGIWLQEMIPVFNFQLLAIIATALLSLFIYAGKNISSAWQYGISAVILIGISMITTLCLSHFDAQLFLRNSHVNLSSAVIVAPILLFSLLGFETISSLYAIVKNPRKNVLLGGVIGVFFVGMLYIAFSGSIIGAVDPSHFIGSEKRSLAMTLTNVFPQLHILSKLIYLGGLFAILGTLHSVLWSVSVLLLGIVKKMQNRRIQQTVAHCKMTSHHTLAFSCLVIMGTSFLSSTLIMNIAVLLIATSYVLSITALVFEKTHKMMNRLICIVGLFGGCLMGAFAIYAMIHGF